MTSHRESDANDDEGAWSFAVYEHGYLSELIRYADQKAAFTFALAVGAIAFGLDRGTVSEAFENPLVWLATSMAEATGSLLLVVAAALGLSALLPRLWSTRRLGFVFWDHIAGHGSAETYADFAAATKKDALAKEILRQCFGLAGICRRKFSLIKWSLWICVGGTLLLSAGVLQRAHKESQSAESEAYLRSAYFQASYLREVTQGSMNRAVVGRASQRLLHTLSEVRQRSLTQEQQAVVNACGDLETASHAGELGTARLAVACIESFHQYFTFEEMARPR